MKYNFKAFSILSVLILILSGCASTSTITLPYEYPKEKLSASAASSIAIAYPEDKRIPDEDIDKIWSGDPVEEIGKVIQEEIKSTGLFREVLYADNEQISESGVRMVLFVSVIELEWDIPDLAEPIDSTSVLSRFMGVLYKAEFTDLYGKAKIKVMLVDQNNSHKFIDKEYYSRAKIKMTRYMTDLYGQRARVIGKALKRVMGQLKFDLKRLSKEDKI